MESLELNNSTTQAIIATKLSMLLRRDVNGDGLFEQEPAQPLSAAVAKGHVFSVQACVAARTNIIAVVVPKHPHMGHPLGYAVTELWEQG